MGETLLVLLPLLALVLAGASIAGLWYWWSSGQEEAAEGQDTQPAGKAEEQRNSPSQLQPVEPTVGDMVGKVTSTAQSWIANIARAASTPAAGSTTAPGYASTGLLSSTSDGEMVEVMRVLRDLADGRLVVEIGGKRYWGLAEITDPQVRRRFMGNAQAVAQFAQVAQEAASSSSQPPSWPVTTPEVAAQPVPPAQPQLPITYSPLPPAEPPPASTSPAEVTTPAGDSQEQTSGPKTIADEIEELIQLRLSTIPTLMYRSIHIRQGAGGGIRVEVDRKYFDSVADVTDPEVMAFLQSIIREWEARQ